MNIHTFQSMGTHYQFVGIADPIAGEMEHWIHIVEASLSRFSPVSELSDLNQSEGIPVLCSDILWEIIGLADHYYQETERIFNPYLGRILSELGYNQSFENIDPDQCATPTVPLPKVAHPVVLQPEKKAAILHPSFSIDLGGIAKGWSAQKLSSWAKRTGVSCGAIDAGGDMAIWGNEDALGWEVLIENPWETANDLVYLRVTKEVGIATSSIIKRQWGEGHHHIIDPRTLQSSQSDLIQVTILAPDLTLAEVYTKVFLILGSEQGIHCVQQKQPQLAYILVKTDRTVMISANLQDYASEWKIM